MLRAPRNHSEFAPVQNRPYLILTLIGVIISPATVHSAGDEHGARETFPAPSRQRELIRMVRHDCGACHGITLTGGLGPALDRQSLAHRSRDYLQATILLGHPGTAMPGWKGVLEESEAHWIAQRLHEGFPDER